MLSFYLGQNANNISLLFTTVFPRFDRLPFVSETKNPKIILTSRYTESQQFEKVI